MGRRGRNGWSVDNRRLLAGVVNCLRGAEGGWRSTTEIIEHLYGHLEDGGPDWAEDCVHVAVYMLRRRHGYPIESAKNRGYRYAWSVWEVEMDPPGCLGGNEPGGSCGGSEHPNEEERIG